MPEIEPLFAFPASRTLLPTAMHRLSYSYSCEVRNLSGPLASRPGVSIREKAIRHLLDEMSQFCAF